MTPSQPSSKGKLLKEQLEMVSYTTFDGLQRFTIKPIEDTLSFDKGFYVFVRALQMLRSHNDGVTMVGLGGPSGSGKTAFSEKIRSFWPGVVVISMDMYNQGDKVIDENFDDPRITDYKTLLANLQDLRDGKTTQIPVYDFKSSSRLGYRQQQPPEARVVIIEGIYALSEQLRPLLDLRVSITGGVHFDLVKRVMRDISRVGQDAEGIIQQITDTVYPMFKVFIEPDLKTAQLKITNAFNPFSGFMSPTYMVKSNHVPEISVIKKALQDEGLAVVEKSEVELYDIYLVPPNQDPETCQSWLRMRNKDGRYSLLFEEWVTEGPFIISPRVSFEVNVRVMGGLMSLGYEVGAVMHRGSVVLTAQPELSAKAAAGAAAAAAAVPEGVAAAAAAGAGAGLHSHDADPQDSACLTVKVDTVQHLGRFITILGKDRTRVAALGKQLGLEGAYIPYSFIEQAQMFRLTNDFAPVTSDWKRRFATSASLTPPAADGPPPASRTPPHASAAAGSRPGLTVPRNQPEPEPETMSGIMAELKQSPHRNRASLDSRAPRTTVATWNSPGASPQTPGPTPASVDAIAGALSWRPSLDDGGAPDTARSWSKLHWIAPPRDRRSDVGSCSVAPRPAEEHTPTQRRAAGAAAASTASRVDDILDVAPQDGTDRLELLARQVVAASQTQAAATQHLIQAVEALSQQQQRVSAVWATAAATTAAVAVLALALGAAALGMQLRSKH